MCYLSVLHEKFQAKHKEISYSWFCKLIPDNIVKLKPQDWGTCLCRTYLEMKLEAVNKLPQFMQKPRRVQDEELSEFIDEVKNIKSNMYFAVLWSSS